MKRIVLVSGLMSFYFIGEAQRPELETRKTPVYNCGDLEYDEGTDVVYLKNVPFTGKCKSYYENNSLEREVEFLEGKEHGVSKTYYQWEPKETTDDSVVDDGRRKMPGDDKKEDKNKDPEDVKGQLQSVTTFSMGVADGTWEYYYANGNMAWSNTFAGGLKAGRWSWFFENGNPKKVESYLDDLKDGEYITWYEGKDSTFKKAIIHYKAGRLDGSYKLFYENGQLKSEEMYVQDKVDGESLMYYENGQMAIQQRYKNGFPDGEWREFHDNGQERKFEKYVNGKKEGEHKQYFKEGQVKSIAMFKQDKLISLEEYDEFGNKLDTSFKTLDVIDDGGGKKKKKKKKEKKKKSE